MLDCVLQICTTQFKISDASKRTRTSTVCFQQLPPDDKVRALTPTFVSFTLRIRLMLFFEQK